MSEPKFKVGDLVKMDGSKSYFGHQWARRLTNHTGTETPSKVLSVGLFGTDEFRYTVEGARWMIGRPEHILFYENELEAVLDDAVLVE